jgi:hypothetical protein
MSDRSKREEEEEEEEEIGTWGGDLGRFGESTDDAWGARKTFHGI